MLGRHLKNSNYLIEEWLYFFIVIITLLAIPIWIVLVAPSLKKIPDNFSYTADILSLDNFYDETAKKFEGEHISKTIFSYQVVQHTSNLLIIKNVFDVRKLSNQKIFAVDRYYYVNPYNGKHVKYDNQELRSGYLFAPRYVNKHDFYYWHVNYDAPALMKYVNTEKIYGLDVYHYQAHYEADQTENLHNLPGVPAQRGIKADVVLQLWIEPVSGWLVKYQDNTLAFYYDIKTGKIISPWNSFSNRYTQTSIHNQERIAKILKLKILATDYIVPILLICVSGFYYWLIRKKRAHPSFRILPTETQRGKIRKLCLPYCIATLIIVATSITFYYIYLHKKRLVNYTIGISQWSHNPDYIETIRGFKDGLAEFGFIDGKNVTFIIRNPTTDIENQINIIQSFVKNKVDLIFTLTTPGTLVAKGITKKIPIVFSDVTYPTESEIISSLKSSNNNLVGSRNYISGAEQYYQFNKLYPNTKILGFVHHKGESDSEIQYQEFKTLLNKQGIIVIDIAAIDLEDLRNKLNEAHIDTLYLACDAFIQGKSSKVVADFARNKKIASFSCDKRGVLNGILAGYIADAHTVGKIAGKKAALILKGAEVKWLRTESPEQGYLIVNIPTAELLHIKIPKEKLQQANFIVNQ